MGNFYAVANGRNPGIYDTWDECQKQIIGFAGAKYKKFNSYDDAVKFVDNPTTGYDKALEEKFTTIAYVDGSYNAKKKIVGYGGFVHHKGNDNESKMILQGSTTDDELIKYRNVAGEVLGATAAMKYCIEKGYPDVAIFYDYQGIESWATGDWKCNNPFTQNYNKYYNSIKDKLSVAFVKVKGHTGIEGNEEVDKLAKQAVGIE